MMSHSKMGVESEVYSNINLLYSKSLAIGAIKPQK